MSKVKGSRVILQKVIPTMNAGPMATMPMAVEV